MQRLIFAKILLMTSSTLLATQVLAATPRYSTVVSSLYSFNHPYAAQASNELATKMTKMAVSPFSFYRGTSHLFYKDMTTLPASSYTNASTNKVWLQGDMHLQNFGRDDMIFLILTILTKAILVLMSGMCVVWRYPFS